MIHNLNRQSLILAIIVGSLSPTYSHAEGYAFAGLNIDKLNVFWQSSVVDATNLTQGPLRDGTGSQVDLSDFNSTGAGGSSTGMRADLESTHATGTFATCLGPCLKAANDYSRPPSQPTDPLHNVQFVRTNVDANAALFSVSHLTTTVHMHSYAELELNSAATGAPADASSSFEIIRLFSPLNADRMVFDFDADDFMRSIRQVGLPVANVDANNSFEIKLVDNNSNTTVFDFSPNGTGVGGIGATVVADPFDLNNHETVEPPYPSRDLQFSNVGQFRAITPALTPGAFYFLTITAGSAVSAKNVPEPPIAALGLLAVPAVFSFFRMRGSKSKAL